MTTYEHDPDDRLLDRMVDGELQEHEQRRLLARLDSDGWRKLALAYVESQTWRSEFASFAQERVAPTQHNPIPTSRTRLLSFSLAALVIGFLLAVGLGYRYDLVPQQDRNLPQPRVIAERREPAPTVVPIRPAGPEMMRFVIDGGAPDGAWREIDIPLFNASQVDDEWIELHATTIPPYLREALERRGHQVIERRHWYPVELSDGRRVLLPVDDVRLQFATTALVQ